MLSSLFTIGGTTRLFIFLFLRVEDVRDYVVGITCGRGLQMVYNVIVGINDGTVSD